MGDTPRCINESDRLNLFRPRKISASAQPLQYHRSRCRTCTMTPTPLPISIQLYSLRNAGDLDRQLDIVREAGFDQVELIGSQLEDAVATRAKLDARGLVASSAHV